MRLTDNAFNQAEGLVSAILSRMSGIGKAQRKFFFHIFTLWLSVRGRYTFMNLGRHGPYVEQSYRNQFEKEFNFFEFNAELISQTGSGHHVAAFDPSFLPKAGKKTPHKGRFWNGKESKNEPGIEVGVLAMVDVEYKTAFALESIQSPSSKELNANGMTLIDHYREYILSHVEKISVFCSHLTTDGYFMKKDFILPILEKTSLHIITKMRRDANLQYIYEGPQSKGSGRPRTNGGKVNLKQIDKKYFRKEFEDEGIKLYSALLWCVALKRKVKIAYVQYKSTGVHDVFLGTDLEMDGATLYKYYRLRYQIEFLIRDAKQHTGLEQCQARSENKLHFHHNMALASASLAKATLLPKQDSPDNSPFSIGDIKTEFFNRLFTKRIFSILGFDEKCKKLSRVFKRCVNFGKVAA